MERIRQMPLKKALFTIAFINITIALILSLLSIWACVALRSQIATEGIVIKMHSGSVTVTQISESTEYATAKFAVAITELISVVQIFLPILIYIIALITTASTFYHLKLKEPLETLAGAASRIIENDLDFMIAAKSQDELGQLCTAFETMRKALLDNNRELWRQAEERKRLNAAFSHNLRNPVTVLKGSAKLARKCITDNHAGTEQIADNLSRIENYTHRIERYIETMSSIQRLEEIPIEREPLQWDSLISELENMIHFAALDSSKKVNFRAGAYPKPVLIDKSILFQITENLISNALRFAAQNIDVFCSINETLFELTITDDGCGFPDTLLKKGIQPFQKGNEDAEHFGMGLYTCNLLCQRHGGNILCENHKIGATVSATLKIL